MSHIPPRLRKRAGDFRSLPPWPPLLDSRGRPILPMEPEDDGLGPAMALAVILLSGVLFAGAVVALSWGFVLLEAALS